MKIIHSIFNLHKWKLYKKVWDYSEPHPGWEGGGDWLPTKGRFYRCTCGAEKRVYTDGFTHLGTEPARIFYV